MLAQAREKYASIAGPQGGTALNGASLKAEAQADIDRLTIELTTSVAGSNNTGYSLVIG